MRFTNYSGNTSDSDKGNKARCIRRGKRAYYTAQNNDKE